MEYRLLGPVEVERDGRALPLGGPKQRAVLAILLLRRGSSLPSDVLIDELWGERSPPTARNALQGYVFQLRKVLEPNIARREAHRVLVSDGAGYRIAAEEDDVDAWRFERLVTEARLLVDGSPARAVATLDAALALWRGPALADLSFEQFAQTEAQRLEELRLAAEELRFEALVADGRHATVVGELEAAVARHPTRERLQEHLLLALYRCGRQADALEAYGRAREHLLEQLGVEPGEGLKRLHVAILNQDPALDPPAPEVPIETRPAPRVPTRLLGRESELEELSRLLENHRVVTLVGPGGVGKTRLALEVARREAHRFPGGVLWFPLETAREAQTVAEELIAAVGADDVSAELDGRCVLLVLDNLEQVLGCAARIAQLVGSTEGPVVLATSRAPLDIAAERRYPVPTLEADAAAALFRDRADALGVALDRDDVVVRDICARLDGLPLAVELAAARTPTMAPPELLERLDDRLRLLEGSRRDAPERQRTLRGAIEWSHALLDPAERRLFAALGIFSGGWTIEAAEVVCGADLDTLRSLVEKSLVRREGPRYSMLETVRDFASERLEQASRDGVGAAHTAFYCGLVRRLDVERPDGWIRMLEAEHANVRSALDRALVDGQVDLALETLASLHTFWDAHGYAAEGLRRLELALGVDGGTDLPRSRALYAAGILHAHERRYVDAERLHRLAADLARSQGDDAVLSRALNGVAVALYRQERHDEAERTLQEAFVLKERLGDARGAAVIKGSLGNALRAAGRLAEAEAHYEAAVAGLRAAGDEMGEAVALDNLGSVRIAAGDSVGAVPLLRRAVDLAREVDALSTLASACAHLGCALLHVDRQEAYELLERSSELFRELGEPDGGADALDGLAAWFATEDGGRAGDLFRRADALRAECGSKPGIVELMLRAAAGVGDAGHETTSVD